MVLIVIFCILYLTTTFVTTRTRCILVIMHLLKFDTIMLQNPPKWKMMSTPNSENIFSMFNSVTKRYHCLRCDKTCETRSGLRQHYQSHIGKFSYWCEVCAKGFTGKSHFDAHVAKHEGRTFSCPMCSKTFRSKRGMQRHHAEH